MEEYIIEVEADTLKEAKEQVKSKIPNGLHLISEKILSDGKPKTVKAIAETLEKAYVKAESEIPNNAHIIKKKELSAPKLEKISFESEDDSKAQIYIKKQVDKTTVVKELQLTIQGRKGFLGIGKKLNQYCADVLHQAVVKVTYKTNARICAQVGEKLTNWPDLLAVIQEIKENPLSAASLFSQYPHQILFAIISGKIENPSYFDGIPFVSITKGILDKARHYIETPPIPSLYSMFGLELLSNRYVVMSNGEIGRKSESHINGLIMQVAGCLKGRGTYNINDGEKMAKYAYDAIIHYQNIPIVFYFFTLPYLESVISPKEISIQKALISAYKGVEGLILGMYDELGEGEVITDERIVSKVRKLFGNRGK